MESRYLDEVVAEGEQGVERAGAEIRDGELRAEARGVESVRGRGLTGGGGRAEEEGAYGRLRDGCGSAVVVVLHPVQSSAAGW